MRRPSLRAALLAGLLAAAVTASLLASGLVPGGRSHRLVNVGGSTNACHCTHRIER